MKLNSQVFARLLFTAFLLSVTGCNRQTSSRISPSPTIESTASPTPVQTTPDNIPSDAAWQYIYDNRESLGACNGEIDQQVSQDASSVYAVNENTYLVEFLCFMAAYQGNYEYYLYRETPSEPEIQRLTLTEYLPGDANELEAAEVTSIGGLPTYEPQQKQLTVFTKYRGLGDCGSYAEYQFEEEEFQLLEYRVKPDCDGNYVDPQNYNKVYP